VFTFVNPVGNLKQFIREMADAMHVPVYDNRVDFPKEIASGYMRVDELPDGLLTLCINNQLNTELHFERTDSEEERYMLRFEHLTFKRPLLTKIDDETVKNDEGERKTVYLTCSMIPFGYYAPKGTTTNSVLIELSREWLGKYLRMDTYDELLKEYLRLKTASLLFEPLDGEYQLMLDEIAELDKDHPAYDAQLQNRILYLVERFFTNLYEKRNQLRYKIRISKQDIENIRKVESLITKEPTAECPSINELSKKASMSPSKLKALFKDIYGRPIYQHYQHHRMMKARSMLLSTNCSVKEVGLFLGYANLSNFSTAFKKEFNILPHELLKESWQTS
jgi:AraC-like DNA-binding protein